MGDFRKDKKFIGANEILNLLPNPKDVEEAINETKDAAPGKDNVRIRYIKRAAPKVRNIITNVFKKMFLERASSWDDILKTKQIVTICKKRAKDDGDNYRGVSLLAMGSRIQAKIMSKRLRDWAEDL